MLIRLAALSGLLLVSACAEPARQANMIAAPVQSAQTSPLANTLCVSQVTGGEETNPLWTSEVDDATFRAALAESLRASGLSAQPDACRMDVAANLLGLAQPIAGFDMEVTANVNYSVVPTGGQDPYFQSTVTTPFTAEFSSAFMGVERLRLANEGAVRTNINEFINRLVTHSLTTPPGS